MTLDSARGSDGCEASPRLPTGLCGSRIRTDDSLYVPCSRVSLLDDRIAADGHGGAKRGLPSVLSSLIEPMDSAPPAGDQPLVVR